jgi:hypothetical protein
MTYKQVEVTPTITAGAYSALDAVGGLLEFEDACTPYANYGEIVGSVLTDNAKQSVLLYLALFSKTFTPTADNSPFAVSDADLQNFVGMLRYEVADYIPFNANSVAMVGFDGLAFSLPFVLVSGGTSLFGQLMTGVAATPTYVATNDLTIKLTIRR